MNREDLLRSIAETGYNVGFGAKKHFATYDIVAKVPGIIGFASISVGIFALFLDFLSTKFLSAAFIVFGVAGMSMSHYDHKKEEYAAAGGELTQLFNRLRALYFNAKAADGSAPTIQLTNGPATSSGPKPGIQKNGLIVV